MFLTNVFMSLIICDIKTIHNVIKKLTKENYLCLCVDVEIGGEAMEKFTEENYLSGWRLLEAVSKLRTEDKIQISIYVRALSDRCMLEEHRKRDSMESRK